MAITAKEHNELKETLNEALILMDGVTRAVESKDDWAEGQAGAACRTFLSKMEFKTP